MWLIVIATIFSFWLPTKGFSCYKDMCEAGHQYCRQDDQRCHHCKDLLRPCDNSTMLPDCRAFCVERQLREEIQNLQRKATVLTVLKDNVTMAYGKLQEEYKQSELNLSSTRQDIEECKDSLKDFKTGFWISIGLAVCILTIAMVITVTFFLKRKTKLPSKLQEEKGLIDSEINKETRKPFLSNEKRNSKDSALGSTLEGSTRIDDGTDDVTIDQYHGQGSAGSEIGQVHDDININIGIQERGASSEPQDESLKTILLCSPGENEKETEFIN